MTWIFRCDRCGQASLLEDNIPRRGGEYAASLTLRRESRPGSSRDEKQTELVHLESHDICMTCHENLISWLENLDVAIPTHSINPPA